MTNMNSNDTPLAWQTDRHTLIQTELTREADTMPSVMMMTVSVSKESLARDSQTDSQTDRDSGRLLKTKRKMCKRKK